MEIDDYNIKLENIKKYLLLKEWTIEEFKDNFLKISRNVDGDEIEIFIPSRENLKDYLYLVKDLIRNLSQIDDIDEYELIGYINGLEKFVVGDKNFVPRSIPTPSKPVQKRLEDFS